MASSSGGTTKEAVALEFQLELNSLTQVQPPVSKEKINQIVRAAIKDIRNYKHVVYFVEDFIKKCPREYKVPGLYVIDAIIRNCKSQAELKQTTSKHHKEVCNND